MWVASSKSIFSSAEHGELMGIPISTIDMTRRMAVVCMFSISCLMVFWRNIDVIAEASRICKNNPGQDRISCPKLNFVLLTATRNGWASSAGSVSLLGILYVYGFVSKSASYQPTEVFDLPLKSLFWRLRELFWDHWTCKNAEVWLYLASSVGILRQGMLWGDENPVSDPGMGSDGV